MRFSSKVSAFLLLFCLLLAQVASCTNKKLSIDYSKKSRTIQFNVKALLNARCVTTVANDTLVTWNKGIDGDWSGLATRSAADLMGSSDKVAFPNDGIFPASSAHPRVELNFSNAQSKENQVRFSDRNVDDFYSFSVPKNSYSTFSLYFMSAFGTSKLEVTISYSDNSSQINEYSVEDWATRMKEDDTKYFLSKELAKWSNANIEMERDSHFLMGINIYPDSKKEVIKISIHKRATESSCTFFGATGYGASSEKWCVLGNSPFVSYEGRVLEKTDGSVGLGYPGIVTRINYRGSSLIMHTRSNSDELYVDVVIDSLTPVFLKIPKGEADVCLSNGLKEGSHSIEIYKRVESCVGILDVVSFTVMGEFSEPFALPNRRLLFLGDSFTVGQATTVEDGGIMNPSKAMRQNARLSYPRLIADNLKAQCHIIAYAGRGVVRDWQGIDSVRCAPEYYDYTLPDNKLALWNHQLYLPDVIGVCLGNNDFGVGIPDQLSYIKAYAEFVRKLKRDAPDASIFLITSPSLTDDEGKVPYRSVQLAYLNEVVNQIGDSTIRVIQIPNYPVVPGDWHPSGTAHRAVAKLLEPYFSDVLKVAER